MITCVGLIFDDSLFVDIISKLVELIEYFVELNINECRSYYMVLKTVGHNSQFCRSNYL